jgi:hypothetical protein
VLQDAVFYKSKQSGDAKYNIFNECLEEVTRCKAAVSGNIYETGEAIKKIERKVDNFDLNQDSFF